MDRFDLPFASCEPFKTEDVQPTRACPHVWTLLKLVRKGNRGALYLFGDPMKAVIYSSHGTGFARSNFSGRGFLGIMWRG